MKLFGIYQKDKRVSSEKANWIFRDKGRARRAVRDYEGDLVVKEVVVVDKELYDLLMKNHDKEEERDE